MNRCNWNWNGFTILLMGMVIAAIPGFLLAPYCINYFDEPYQILNAYDWPTSIYSPLSAWISHLYGELVDWKYLYFRYFSYSIALLSVFLGALYAAVRSSFSTIIIISAIVSTYFLLIFKTFTVSFGWDNLTFLFLVIDIILIIEIIHKQNVLKILFLSLISSFLILVRIPNISLILFNSAIFVLLICRAIERKRTVYYFLVYLFTTVSLVIIILGLMYGSVKTYMGSFSMYEIGSHSIKDILGPFFRGAVITAFVSLLFYLLYKLFCKISLWVKADFKKLLIHILFFGLFFMFLWPLPNREYGNVNVIAAALYYLALIILLIKFYKSKDWQMCIGIFAISLISTVSALGSNLGFVKALIWPMVPVVVYYGKNYITKNLKIYSGLWVLSLVVYSIFGLNHKSYFNQPLNQMTFEFPGDAGVMAGMKTYKEEGERIYFIYKEVEQYKNKGYDIIPLKEGNSYIWEYLTLTPNLLQRHNFNNWYAFEEEDYVNAISARLADSEKPVLVMYMQWENPDEPTLMEKMLKKKAKCVLNKPGYSFWIKE